MPGTRSTSLEWLVKRLAPRFRDLGFVEVRYRIKSWRRLDLCVEDAKAAVREHRRDRTLLLGFSMGGAVAIASADEARVERVLGLAPWIPPRLDVSPLEGKRLDVLHGSLDRWLPGIPGVSPTSSRAGAASAARPS
jgi:alpha-beta hydrolase superfamily lysophospholipase